MQINDSRSGRKRVAFCVKQIARMVASQGLKPGDRLPAQSELCSRFDVSNNSLTPAMRRLVELGVLTRQVGAGTKIARLDALPRVGWTFGVASMISTREGMSSFYAYLHHHLVAALSAAGVRAQTYVRRQDTHWPHVLDDFYDLEADVNAGVTDGILFLSMISRQDWRRLTDRGVAVCYVGAWNDVPCGVIVDLPSFAINAMERLFRQGFVRIAVAARLLQLEPVQAWLQTLPPGRAAGLESLAVEPGMRSGRVLGQTLAARAPAKRPQAIVIHDDYAAAGMVGVIAEIPDYRPAVAALTNRQLPVSFALPVQQWEIDIELLVNAAQTLLFDTVLRGTAANRQIGVAAQLLRD